MKTDNFRCNLILVCGCKTKISEKLFDPGPLRMNHDAVKFRSTGRLQYCFWVKESERFAAGIHSHQWMNSNYYVLVQNEMSPQPWNGLPWQDTSNWSYLVGIDLVKCKCHTSVMKGLLQKCLIGNPSDWNPVFNRKPHNINEGAGVGYLNEKMAVCSLLPTSSHPSAKRLCHHSHRLNQTTPRHLSDWSAVNKC